MAEKLPSMSPKLDGKLYSRVMRRCVAALKHVEVGRTFELTEMANEIRLEKYPEFLIRRGTIAEPMKAGRIRNYLSYLGEIEMLNPSDKLFALTIAKPLTDPHWAQILSDAGREHLSRIVSTNTEVSINPGQIPKFLEDLRRKMHQDFRILSMASLLSETRVEPKDEESFRWSFYLYLDGDAADFELRRNPYVARRA